jgi:CRP/FNR family cyclic AMP-dependent transcriptional regulator
MDDEETIKLYAAADFVAVSKARSFNIPQNTFQFPVGAMVFREGEMGDSMYIILEGEIQIAKALSDGSSRVLHVMGKGDFFGEMALIDRKKRSATAIVSQSCTLIRIPEDFILRFIEKNPHFVIKMLNTFVSRLRNANRIIERTMVTNPHQVVLEGLREYGKLHGIAVFTGTKITVRDFSSWANYRLGIPENKIPSIVEKLLASGKLSPAASGNLEVVIPNLA